MDENFETDLPKIPDEGMLMGEINLNDLLAGKDQDFTFEMPEEVRTPGFNKETTAPPCSSQKMMNPETFEKMQLNFMASKNPEMLKVMFGDYSEIEQVMENVTEDGTIKKRMLRLGMGKKVQDGDMVLVDYMVGAELMDDLIESTYERKRPKRFRVGAGEVLPVLDIGVLTMRVGEIAKFLATFEHGFGKLGIPTLNGGSQVPPETRVMVQLEILDCYVCDKDDSIYQMSSVDRRELPFEKLFSFAEVTKKEGNREFKQQEYDRAIKRYLEALDVLKDMTPMSKEEKEEYYTLRMQICNNIAHTNFKLENFKKALKYAEDGTKMPLNGQLKGKSFYLHAKCLFEMGRYELCLDSIAKAETMTNSDRDIAKLKAQAQMKVKEAKEMEKQVCARMMAAKISDENK